MKPYKKIFKEGSSIICDNKDIATIGDKVKIVIPKRKIHPGSPTTYEVIINKIINKNLVRGVVNNGPEAGQEQQGYPLQVTNK